MPGQNKKYKITKKETKEKIGNLLKAHAELTKIKASQENHHKNFELVEMFSNQLLELSQRIVEQCKQYFNTSKEEGHD